MPAIVTERPNSDDYASYYARYVSLVPTGDLVEIMRRQIAEVRELFAPLSEAQAGATYAPGKWTVREVLGHLTDTERVFSYRAITFARNDQSPLPGFDQDTWTPQGEFNTRTLSDLMAEWIAVREATAALLAGLPAAALQRRGVASDNTMSALAALTMLVGHVRYHIDHMQATYLPAIGQAR